MMMARVARGEYQATIVDDVLLGLEQAAGLPLAKTIEVGRSRPKAWVVHPSALYLRNAANRFLRRRQRLIKVLRGRYFRPSEIARQARSDNYRADRDGRLSPYDRLFRRAGRATGIDWRLLAAVAFTESRFDPRARSRFGARGLMQLLPATGRRVGIRNISRPRGNVFAGARYLRRLMKAFDEDGVEPRQQVLFALAAYNSGVGHIGDARMLAPRIGKDPNRWFDHVEEALRLKQIPRWHRRTRFGYARARETVAYVRRVQANYEVFVRHAPLSRGR